MFDSASIEFALFVLLPDVRVDGKGKRDGAKSEKEEGSRPEEAGVSGHVNINQSLRLFNVNFQGALTIHDNIQRNRGLLERALRRAHKLMAVIASRLHDVQHGWRKVRQNFLVRIHGWLRNRQWTHKGDRCCARD